MRHEDLDHPRGDQMADLAVPNPAQDSLSFELKKALDLDLKATLGVPVAHKCPACPTKVRRVPNRAYYCNHGEFVVKLVPV